MPSLARVLNIHFGASAQIHTLLVNQDLRLTGNGWAPFDDLCEMLSEGGLEYSAESRLRKGKGTSACAWTICIQEEALRANRVLRASLGVVKAPAPVHMEVYLEEGAELEAALGKLHKCLVP